MTFSKYAILLISLQGYYKDDVMNRNDLMYHKVTKEAYRFNTIG